MTQNKRSKQERLNTDYAEFLIESEAAKGQGNPIGTFIAWRHENDRDGIKILERKK